MFSRKDVGIGLGFPWVMVDSGTGVVEVDSNLVVVDGTGPLNVPHWER